MVAGAGDYVQAIVHTIDQLDIGMARRSKHNLGAGSAASRGMSCEIVRAKVCLGLHDPADLRPAANPPDQVLAEQVARYALGIAVVKAPGQDLHAKHYTRGWSRHAGSL
jgi:hypothetical protein